MIRRTLGSVLPALLATLLAACASGPSTRTAPAVLPAGPPVHVDGHCSMAMANSLIVLDASGKPEPAQPFGTAGGGALPPNFTPVRIFSCDTYVQDVPGDGQWQVATQRSAPDASVAAVVAAYRTTTATVYSGHDVACAEDLDLDPQIAFVDAHGTAIWPAAPRDPMCHHIVPAVGAALKAVQWTVTASQRTNHVQTAGGCPSAYKDMLDVAHPGPAAPGPYYQKTPAKIVACVYQSPDGTFVREDDLTGAALTKALSVLDAAPPAGPCASAAPNRYAVLLANGMTESYLELDGCLRVGRVDSGGGADRSGVRQLDAAGVAALAGS